MYAVSSDRRDRRARARGALRGLAAVACAALALVGAGCKLHAELPPGFLRLDAGGGELKATTPDGARLWVREFDDDDEGSLEFWADAVADDLVRNRGYVPAGTDTIHDGSGREGVLQRYTVQHDGSPHGYLIAIFVVAGTWSSTIRVAEFTAESARFDELEEGVRGAIATLR